ncbi:hypothetical protein N7495_003859 [Penicillium taxi]|uniref:uncharacterized protein n=1 Tax=Penicillium taxi TaxID=168475 RepID=UPI0025458835|nr:uncharacterized protein N7495_003859 [Penicillium taxi]KAJ5899115.1 hypothetical protein N7495_003859 [Penicillium taxi]
MAGLQLSFTETGHGQANSDIFGKTPRVSWRYCNFSLPLGLDFEELNAEPGVLDASLSKLDSNGWDTTGSNGLLMRAVLLMSPVRKSILGLSLSQQAEDFEGKIE